MSENEPTPRDLAGVDPSSWRTEATWRLLRAARREERAKVYVESALAITDAPWMAVAWRKRNCVVVKSACSIDSVETAHFVRTSEEYEAFRRTERLSAGVLDGLQLTGDPLLPECPIGDLPYRMILSEGIASGAPRIFLAGGDEPSIAEYTRFLDALAPHWSERRSLRRQASVDFLTGVYNYRHLRRYLRRMCRRAGSGGRSFALLMVDVDHLRDYNTAFGHLMGSRVLAQIGRNIKQSIRDGDFVAKYGGDEFVVILPGASKSGAVENALRIKTKVNGEGFYGVDAGAITCSIGVAAYGEDGTTYEELVGAADRAVYAAKDKGRNTVVANGRGKLKRQFEDPRLD